MTKIYSTGPRLIAYNYGCDNCSFGGDGYRDTDQARAEIKKHVRETGHSVWVESSYSNKYMEVSPTLGATLRRYGG